MNGNGLSLSTVSETNSNRWFYQTEARADGSHIKQISTIQDSHNTYIYDKTKMTGEKLNLDKTVLIGNDVSGTTGNEKPGLYYNTEAWTGNRETWGWNTLDKYTKVIDNTASPTCGGYQDLHYKTKATGSYEPDNFWLDTTVSLGYFEFPYRWTLGVHEDSFTQGDIAIFSGTIYQNMNGAITTIDTSGYAAPGKIDYDFDFVLDISA